MLQSKRVQGNDPPESIHVRPHLTSFAPRLVAVAAALAIGCCGGCAAETAGWPKMNDFSRISQKVLSPQEQEKAVQSMSAEQKAEQAKAIERIEKTK